MTRKLRLRPQFSASCSFLESPPHHDHHTHHIPPLPPLPTELRLQIWSFTVDPQLITFENLTIRKDHTVSLSLLLVNHEAHDVFLSRHTWQRGPVLPGREDCPTTCAAYIDFSRDVIRVDMGAALSRYVPENEPSPTSACLKWLELAPHPIDLRGAGLEHLTSLRLITVRWPWRIQSIVPNFPFIPRFKTIDIIFQKVNQARLAYRTLLSDGTYSPPRFDPIFAVLFAPGQDFMTQSLQEMPHKDFIFKKPSEETYKRWQVFMPGKWRSMWPARDRFKEEGWFAHEIYHVSQLSDGTTST